MRGSGRTWHPRWRGLVKRAFALLGSAAVLGASPAWAASPGPSARQVNHHHARLAEVQDLRTTSAVTANVKNVNPCTVLTRSVAAGIVGDTSIKGGLSDGGRDCSYANPSNADAVSIDINPFAKYETSARLKSFASGLAYLATDSRAVVPIGGVGRRAFGWSFDSKKIGIVTLANAGGVVFLQGNDQIAVQATSDGVVGATLLTRCKTVARVLVGKLGP